MKKTTLLLMATLMAVMSWAKAFDSSVLLGNDPATLIVKSYAYTEKNYGDEEEPDIQLEPAPMERIAQMWTFTCTDATTNTVGITGIMDGYETVSATVNTTNNTITIACGQKVSSTEYGDIYLFNYAGKDNLVGTITSEGIVFEDMWYTKFIDGSYAGLIYKSIYQSMAALPNGKMAIDNYDPREGGYWTKENDVYIDFDQQTFTATVWNFNDFHVAIDVKLKNDNKFVIDPQIIETDALNMEPYYTTSIDHGEDPAKIIGRGTENTLTMSGQWTCYAPKTGYSWDTYNPATITFDGTFVYPVIEETPATPKDPEFVFFTHWFDETCNATATVNIFPEDADGNDLISRLLTYEFYTKDENSNAVALGTPIAYDNDQYGSTEKKTVDLGIQAKGLSIIGVKSVYKAKGETRESNITWFDIPALTTVPEGLEMKEYPTAGEAHDDNYSIYTSERTSKVAIDGNTIYIQGLLPQCPYGWAKGTINGTKVTIAPMQCQGSSNEYYAYLTSVNVETLEFKDIVFEYNAEEDIYVTSDMIIGNAGTEELAIIPPYIYGMVIGTEKIPDPVVLPEGAEVKAYPFMGQTVKDGYALEFESNANVAVVGDDVYMQGLNPEVPEAWVKGTKNAAGEIVFPTGQNFGVDETKDLDGNVFYSRQFFFVGANYNTGMIEDVVMTYDAEKDYYELQNELFVNAKKSTLDIIKWYLHGCTIGQKEESNLPPLVTVTPPDDLIKEQWKMTTVEMNRDGSHEIIENYCDGGFYTANEADGTYFYIQGLCQESPEIWVKAPLKDGKVVIPASTYISETYIMNPETYEYIPIQLFLTSVDPTTYELADIVFNYDEEKGHLVSEQLILVNADRRRLAYLHLYASMIITRIPDVAATPATPEIPAEGGLDLVDTWSPKIHAIVKRVDVNDNELLADKLYYSVWVEKEGTQQPLVFTQSNYWGLDGDVTEIPYNFNNWDISTGGETITLFQGEEEIKTWSRIGIQAIYYGGGERHTSAIAWVENPTYDGPAGIADLMTEESTKANYFDLQGRRIVKPAHGLFIVNGKKVFKK